VPAQRFICFTRIAQALGAVLPDEAEPAVGISLTYREFLDAVDRLRTVDFPIEREPAQAWPHFVGWRVNYERAAYAVASAVSAPPALWSGPRRFPVRPIPPRRPLSLQPATRPPGEASTDPRQGSGA
jgi:hypothetical protein